MAEISKKYALKYSQAGFSDKSREALSEAQDRINKKELLLEYVGCIKDQKDLAVPFLKGKATCEAAYPRASNPQY